MAGVVSGRGSLRPHGAPYRAVSVAPEIGDRPSRKFAFPMAREGGCVGQGGRTHVGTALPVCPWTLGTLQGHLSVCGVLYGRAPHPRPLPGARFWPVFRQICPLPSEGFRCVAMERGGGLTRDGGMLWMPQDPTRPMTGAVSGRGSLPPHGAPYRAVSVCALCTKI